MRGKAERVADPERPRAVNAAVQSDYARLTGMSPATLTAAMEPYLPIIYVRVLLGPAASPALRERLLRRVEAALRPGGRVAAFDDSRALARMLAHADG